MKRYVLQMYIHSGLDFAHTRAITKPANNSEAFLNWGVIFTIYEDACEKIAAAIAGKHIKMDASDRGIWLAAQDVDAELALEALAEDIKKDYGGNLIGLFEEKDVPKQPATNA